MGNDGYWMMDGGGAQQASAAAVVGMGQYCTIHWWHEPALYHIIQVIMRSSWHCSAKNTTRTLTVGFMMFVCCFFTI